MKCLNRLSSDKSKEYATFRDRQRGLLRKRFYVQEASGGVVEATAGVKPGVRSNIAKGMWFKFLDRKGQRLGQRAYKR